MTRARLPDRRPAATCRVSWRTELGAHEFSVTAGYDPASGALREVFYADGQKSGSSLRDTIQDGCVLVSLLLQHGVPLSGVSRSLATAPVAGGCVPATVIGAIVAALADLEVA